MKLRIYPKKSVVLDALSKRYTEAKAAYEESRNQYEKMANSPLVHNNLDGVKALRDMAEDSLAAIELKIAMLISHGPEEVAAEIEV